MYNRTECHFYQLTTQTQQFMLFAAMMKPSQTAMWGQQQISRTERATTKRRVTAKAHQVTTARYMIS